MKRYFLFFSGVLVLLAAPLFSMDWPSPNGVMTRNFGHNDRGRPHLGISFEGNHPIRSVEEGELLFQRREGDVACRLPSPLGSWVALDHGDGIISIYARLDTQASTPIPNRVERGGHLGEAGISGWSSRRGFFFQLFDRRERRWVNPALISTPPADVIAPIIQSVSLRDQQDRLFNPAQAGTLSQGRYVVLVNATDTLRFLNETPLAPHRIICFLNGSEAGALTFETYFTRDGALMVQRNGLIPTRQVYAPVPAYEVAEVWFSRGQNTLEIIARDITGNSRSVVYRFMVE